MSTVLLDTAPRSRPHLTKRDGQWVVLIRIGAAQVFAAMRWADWKNGRHEWYERALKLPEWDAQHGTWSSGRYRK